jgi:hypothetical protein
MKRFRESADVYFTICYVKSKTGIILLNFYVSKKNTETCMEVNIEFQGWLTPVVGKVTVIKLLRYITSYFLK